MFDVGFAELFLVSLIGLLVLGPERLPAVARTIGGFVRKARTSWYTLKRTIESELATAETAEAMKSAKQAIGGDLEDISRQVKGLKQDLDGGESPQAEPAAASEDDAPQRDE